MLSLFHTLTGLAVLTSAGAFLASALPLMAGAGFAALILTLAAEMWQAAH